MKITKKSLTFAVLLGVLLTVTLPYQSVYGLERDGTKVFEDNNKVYFSADPEISTSSNDQIIFEFKSKLFSGDIDLAFGVDTTKIRPRYALMENETGWFDVTSAFNSIEYEYQGMNKWYFVKKFHVNQNQMYRLKAEIDVLETPVNTKYWVCAKPSSLTMSQAILEDKFLCLDPLVNATYTNRYPINASCDACSGSVNMLVLLNDTNAVNLGDGFQYIRCNMTVNNTRSVIGYLYYTNSSYYACSEDGLGESTTLIDQGNITDINESEDALVVWLHMNGTATDSSKYGYTVTNSGVSFVGGQIGFAGDFVPNDYMTIADQTTFNFSNGITIAYWLLTSSTNTYIMDKRDGGTDDFYILFHTSNCPMFAFYTGAVTELYCTKDVTSGYHHIAHVWNTTDMFTYIDGVLNATTSKTGTPPDGSAVINFGRRFNNVQHTNADIDEISIYNRYLSADEIVALYNNTKGGQSFAPLGSNQTIEGNVTPPTPNVTVTNLTESTTICIDSNSLLIRQAKNVTNNGISNFTIDDEYVNCLYGCQNNSWIALGNPACAESPVMTYIIIIIVVVICAVIIQRYGDS